MQVPVVAVIGLTGMPSGTQVSVTQDNFSRNSHRKSAVKQVTDKIGLQHL